MHDQDMYHPFDQDLLPHSRLNIAHWGSSEERVHFQSSVKAKNRQSKTRTARTSKRPKTIMGLQTTK